jgi:lysozyme family protein
MPEFEALRDGYAAQWKNMSVKPGKVDEVDVIARKLFAHKDRYQMVADKTGVPWYALAALHERESSADFSTYLGNGEPLNRVTRLVPRGRGPFDSWEGGAIDALQFDELDKVKDWSIERVAYECERYNGWGYHNHGVPSAYLWSFTNIYRSGKYVADGVWSSSVVDQQCGTMPIIKVLLALDEKEKLLGSPKPVPGPEVPELHDLGQRIKRTMLAKGYP